MKRCITRVFAAVAAGAALSAAGVTGVSVSGAAARAPQAARASLSGTSRTAAVPGAQLWARRYNGARNGPGNGDDLARSVAVSPRGGKVFVTGVSQGATSSADYATVAYSAATGARLWARRYNGPGNRGDSATSVAVSPSGGNVFVPGTSQGATSGEDYATVAYSAATGARLWARRSNGPGNHADFASSVAVSPNGGPVFVTVNSRGVTSDD